MSGVTTGQSDGVVGPEPELASVAGLELVGALEAALVGALVGALESELDVESSPQPAMRATLKRAAGNRRRRIRATLPAVVYELDALVV